MRIEYTFWEFLLTVLLLISLIRLFIIVIAYKELQKKISSLSDSNEMLSNKIYLNDRPN